MKERELTNLIVVEVIETLKGEVFLLNLLDHLLWKLLELSQRRHRLPPVETKNISSLPRHSNTYVLSGQKEPHLHSLVNHLA